MSSWALDDILVGRFQAKLLPKQFEVINLMEKSTISDLAEEGQLKKGDLIARVNHEELCDEKEELEMNIKRDKIASLDKIRELEEQRRKLKFYIGLSEQERKFEKELTPKNSAPPEEAIEDLTIRIDLTKEECEFNAKRKLKLHEAKEKKATFRMPFDGRLQFHFIKPDDLSQPFECAPVAQFASICDDSVYYIAISITEATLTQLPEKNFYVRIPLPAGKEMMGSFDYRRVEGKQNADMLVYYFTVPDKDKERAFSMIGSTAKAELFYKCPAEAKSISKAELALDPNAEGIDNWAELIERSYPEYNILLEAEEEVIILPKGIEP